METVFIILLTGMLGLGQVSSAAADAAGKCGYYVNKAGHQMPRPCGNWQNGDARPQGATAKCADGNWSWSEHPYARGTCSHHGDVVSR